MLKKFGLIVFLLALVQGCSTSPQVTSIYGDGAYKGRVQDIVVVAIGKDRQGNKTMEGHLTELLQNSDVSAQSITDSLELNYRMDEQTITAFVTSTEADAILVTRLGYIQPKAVVTPAHAELRTQQANNGKLSDIFVTEYVELLYPEKTEYLVDVMVIAEMYSRETGKLIWSAESSVMNQKLPRNVRRTIAGALVIQMERDGMFR